LSFVFCVCLMCRIFPTFFYQVFFTFLRYFEQKNKKKQANPNVYILYERLQESF
jgi:hypothetical protein